MATAGRSGGPPAAAGSAELEQLIVEQAKDAASFRVFSLSVDGFANGADVVHERRRGTAHDERHGTLGCYVNEQCRCPSCRAESARYARDRRRRTPLIACRCGTMTRSGRCKSCGMRDLWARRAAA